MIGALLLLALPSDLVGDWIYAGPHRPGALAPVETCGTDFGITYAADGTYTTFNGDERGRWRVRGDTLRQTPTHEWDELRDAEVAVRGRRIRFRIRWLDRDHATLIHGDRADHLLRCRAERAP